MWSSGHKIPAIENLGVARVRLSKKNKNPILLVISCFSFYTCISLCK